VDVSLASTLQPVRTEKTCAARAQAERKTAGIGGPHAARGYWRDIAPSQRTNGVPKFKPEGAADGFPRRHALGREGEGSRSPRRLWVDWVGLSPSCGRPSRLYAARRLRRRGSEKRVRIAARIAAVRNHGRGKETRA
jgi:hypothetical protein